MEITDSSLHLQLSNYIYNNWRFNIPLKTWDDSKLPEHLKVRISIIDGKGKEIKSSRDSEILYDDYSNRLNSIKSVKKAKESFERSGITKWDFNEPIDKKLIIKGITYYPGLKVAGDTVSLKLFDREKMAQRSHLEGIALLGMNSLNNQLNAIKHDIQLTPENRLIINYFSGEKEYYRQFFYKLVRNSIKTDIRSKTEFNKYTNSLSLELLESAQLLNLEISPILSEYKKVRNAIYKGTMTLKGRSPEFMEDISVELDRLMPNEFIIKTESFSSLLRYLTALRERINKGVNNPSKDRDKREDIRWFENEYSTILSDLSPAASTDKLDLIDEYLMLLEEYRVSIYAGNIKIPVKVSDVKLEKLLDKIDNTIILYLRKKTVIIIL
ncbi:MAG: hypothetical protein B6229_07415 [Spirochaetaceae bacterium 4572_7]|nr:MAG: hypothetical protein B6229_07415 [Spirochaetaceae bacterium 4572_7]